MSSYYVLKTKELSKQDNWQKFAEKALRPARLAFGRKINVVALNPKGVEVAKNPSFFSRILRVVLFGLFFPVTLPMTLVGSIANARSKSYKDLKNAVKEPKSSNDQNKSAKKTNACCHKSRTEETKKNQSSEGLTCISSKKGEAICPLEHSIQSEWGNQVTSDEITKLKTDFNFNDLSIPPHAHLLQDSEYLTIDHFPQSTKGFGAGFKNHPVYFNASSQAVRLTPLHSTVKVLSKSGQSYEIPVSRAIVLNTVHAQDVNYVWVAVGLPQQEGIDKSQQLQKWWTHKLSPGPGGSFVYYPGLVKELFADFKGHATHSEAIEVQLEKESGNLYFTSATDERLYFAKPHGFKSEGIEEHYRLKGSFGVFQVDVEKGQLAGKTAFVVKSVKPLELA